LLNSVNFADFSVKFSLKYFSITRNLNLIIYYKILEWDFYRWRLCWHFKLQHAYVC